MSDYSEGEYSETTQLRTRCTILESQIQVLEKQNAELKGLVTKLYPKKTHSIDKKYGNWKDVDNVGKFPVPKDDGDFQV
jgi:hypothetical protein